MKRLLTFLLSCGLVCSATAGFKVKLIKPKKQDQFQTRVAVEEVTFAADLLIEVKDQKEFFHKELAPSRVIAVRLAVFNKGTTEVVVPIDQLQLTDPEGREVTPVAPEAVAQAVLQGMIISSEPRETDPVSVTPTMRDPRMDPTDPRYDPRYGRYPPGTTGPWMRPGVDIILNPGGGGGDGNLSQIEQALVEKDFADKAHSMDPIIPSATRDKFLYFAVAEMPDGIGGFVLRLPPAKGIPREIVIEF